MTTSLDGMKHRNYKIKDTLINGSCASLPIGYDDNFVKSNQISSIMNTVLSKLDNRIRMIEEN